MAAARRRQPIREAFEARYVIDGATECWQWIGSFTGKKNCSYGSFIIQKFAKGDGTYGRHRMPAHRLSWELYRGPIPPGMFVCHKCDNHACVNPDHLFLGTPKQNSEDMVYKERQARGAKQGGSRLTEERAQQILDAAGRINDIAIRFNISYDTVYDIKRRNTWKHLKPSDNLPYNPIGDWIPRGSSHRGSVLTEPEIPLIRARCDAGEGYAKIAADYGVTRVVIRKIHLRKLWTHVP